MSLNDHVKLQQQFRDLPTGQLDVLGQVTYCALARDIDPAMECAENRILGIGKGA